MRSFSTKFYNWRVNWVIFEIKTFWIHLLLERYQHDNVWVVEICKERDEESKHLYLKLKCDMLHMWFLWDALGYLTACEFKTGIPHPTLFNIQDERIVNEHFHGNLPNKASCKTGFWEILRNQSNTLRVFCHDSHFKVHREKILLWFGTLYD